MIFADTNVVIDFCGVTVERTERARLVRDQIVGSEPLVIAEAVLAECFWVLRQSYGWDEQEAADVLSDIASSSEFALENEILTSGLAFKRERPAFDIADCLLAARVTGGGTLLTHDSRLRHAVELELKGATDE